MANLVLAFGEALVAAILVDAALKGDSVQNVINGTATSHPLPGSNASAGGGSSSSGGSSIPAGSYTNPVPGAGPSRIDQGGDYTLSSQGFLAPGRSKILMADASNSGWAGGGYIAAQLLDGPLAGSVYYVAEGIKPIVQVGQEVAAGTQLVVRTNNPYNGILGNIEAGWANPSSPGQPLAQVTGGYGEGTTTAAGAAWDKFVTSLGGVADRATSSVMGHLSGVLAGL